MIDQDLHHGAMDQALELLGAGVPLSLLLDLATAVDSSEVYSQEPASTDWIKVA